jgi:hypothetical protein
MLNADNLSHLFISNLKWLLSGIQRKTLVESELLLKVRTSILPAAVIITAKYGGFN